MTIVRTTLKTLLDTFYIPEFQELENTLFELFNKLNIDKEEGKTLKNIAELVGCSIFSETDLELSRLIIKGTIAAKNSRGTLTDVAATLKILTNDEDVIIEELYPGALQGKTTKDLSNIKDIINQLMKLAIPAGVDWMGIVYIPQNAFILGESLLATASPLPLIPAGDILVEIF